MMRTVLIALLALSLYGCKSHRETAVNYTSTADAKASEVSTTESYLAGLSRDSSYYLADSVRVTIMADSIVQPDGTTIHRPAIAVTAHRPSSGTSAASVVFAHSTDSTAAETAAVIDIDADRHTQSDITAITEPPDNITHRIFAVLVLIVFAFFVYRFLR